MQCSFVSRDLNSLSPTLEEKENLPTGSATPPQLTPLTQSPAAAQLTQRHNVTPPQSNSSSVKQDAPHTLTPPHTPTHAHTVTKHTNHDNAILIIDSTSGDEKETSVKTDTNSNKKITPNSLLGKRRNSERGRVTTEKGRGSATDNSGPVITYYTDSANHSTDASKSDSNTKMEAGMENTGTENTGTENTGIENGEVIMSEEKAQQIRDRTQADIDDMLATIPFEELAGFPLIQPSPVATPLETTPIVTTPLDTTPILTTPLSDSDSGLSNTSVDMLNSISYTATVSPTSKDVSKSPVYNTTTLDNGLLELAEVKGYLQEDKDLQQAVKESLQTQVHLSSLRTGLFVCLLLMVLCLFQ